MKKALISIGVVGGVGMVAYRQISKTIEKLRDKKEEEINRIQEEWFCNGWNGGYEAGKSNAALSAILKQTQHSDED